MTGAPEMLTDTFRQHEHLAPDAGDVLVQIRVGTVRATRRRLALRTAAAVAAIVVAVPIAYVWADRHAQLSVVPADAPTRSRTTLIPGPLPAVPFPLTPGWLPPGLHSNPTAGALWIIETSKPDEPAFHVSIAPRHVKRAGSRQVPVGGKPGEFLTADARSGQTSVSFERSPGRWVTIVGFGGRGTEATLVRIATNLRDEPVTSGTALKFALLPKGYVPMVLSPYQVVLRLSEGNGREDPRRFRIHYRKLFGDHRKGERVLVGGREAWLRKAGLEDPMNPEDAPRPGATRYRYLLEIPIENGQYLRVETPDNTELSRADVLRFAAGITVPAGVDPGT
jgi:hypothetical protein